MTSTVATSVAPAVGAATASPALASPTFASLGVPQALVAVLEQQGKASAFPIQADTLPDTLAGRDVLGRGKTGSGKTLAFTIPMVARLGAGNGQGRNEPHRPRGLVLAPTRELATQIAEVATPLAHALGLRVTTVFGGVKQSRQQNALDRGAAIVVACPGRLEDLMRQGIISLSSVQITVIDEADLMADMGFLPGVTRILKATQAKGQHMLFSATLDNGVDRLVHQFLHDPKVHSVDSAESHVDTMTHHVFEVSNPAQKSQIVQTLASGTGRRILFFRTKHHAKRAAKQLTAAGIPAVDLQGNLSQNARERNLAAFESGKVHVLAATDVAARGVDVANVELVIHVDPPTEHKEYLHRSGRTARAGHSGDVVTLCLPQERRDLASVLRRAKIRTQPIQVTADSPEVEELVGERAPRVAPVIVAPVQQGRSGGPQRSRGRNGGPNASGGRGHGRSNRRGGSGSAEQRNGGSRSGGSRSGNNGGAAAFSSQGNRGGSGRRH
ncbi:DEAD/DEAH box helicase [Propionibacterium sp.]|uniref:DEAD/DEAH box helicase n=1 Tax=Propionibacterium sp. TaxID=1977903 RepID=UPI0039EB5926